MTDDSKWFSNLTPMQNKEYVTFMDDKKGKVKIKGIIKVNEYFISKDVALVKHLKYKLLYLTSFFLCWRSLLRSLSTMSSFIIHLAFYFPTLMYLVIVHIVLVQKRERDFVLQCFGYDPCLLCHGVHFPCRHDFQLDGCTPALR
jgi:hypothetical protein